jgi:protein SCO1
MKLAVPNKESSARARGLLVLAARLFALRRRFGSIVVVLALLVNLGACRRTPPPAQAEDGSRAGARADRPDFGGDFTLTHDDNQPFQLTQLRGKAVLLFFGYTSCPDMCPMSLAHVIDVLKELGDARAEVTPVFVSLDPQRDTPATIKTYVTHFGPEVIGLTGTAADIARVAAQYRVSYNIVDSGATPGGGSKDYLINHTTAIFLIDRHGVLRNYYANNEPVPRLAAAVLAVLPDR